MVDERKVVYEAVLDTKKATRAAQQWEKRLEGLTKREKNLTAQEKALTAEMDRLRAKLLALSRAEASGKTTRERYNKETKEARLRLREQAEAARLLRREQAQLKRQTADLRREEERHRRAIEKSTAALRRNEAATRRAQARSARADVRLRSVYQKQGEAGGRIEALQAEISALDAKQLRMSTVGGRLRERYGGRVRERFRRATSDEAVIGYTGQAISGAPGFAARGIGLAATGVAATGGAVGAIARVGGQREQLRAGLATALGSEQEAERAFEQIKRFASETPYAVDEVTSAVTKLKVRGLEPTVDAATEALRTYGDVAGAMGKDLDTVIEAVSDASLGEFERLKEAFNVVGRKSGDEVKLTFAGVTTTVKNDAESITNYLKNLSKTNFAGGMAKQAQTIAGAWSNLGDAVSNFAEEIYQAGLGDALKEVLQDIIGNVNGADDLATTIGENLADAVREGYEWFKKLLGPTDELPDKFAEAFQTGKEFVGMMGRLVSVAASLAETLGTTGVAMTAFVAAAASALGPLGAIAAAAAATGYALTTMLVDADNQLAKVQQRVADVRRQAELAAMQAEADALQEEVRAGQERFDYGQKTYDQLVAARLRATGAESVKDLSTEEQVKLARAQLLAERAGSPEERAQIADLVTRSEQFADKREFERLRKMSKKTRTPSQEKRLRELAGKLDVKLPTGGGGKRTLSAAEQEQKAAIDKAAKEAGLRAADRARLAGRGSDALAEGARAEKETRERLKAQAGRGEALPGQIDTAFARIAGYGEVGAAPPPPVIVNNYQFKVEVPINVDKVVAGSVDEFVDEAASKFKARLEEDVFPETLAEIRSSTQR